MTSFDSFLSGSMILRKALPIVFGYLFIAILSGVHNSLPISMISLLLLLTLCATALPITRVVFHAHPFSFIFALPVGYVIHSLLLSILFVFVPISWLSFLIYFCLAVGLSLIGWRLFSPIPERKDDFVEWKTSDVNLLCFWLIVTFAAVALPYLHVGIETSDGFAYRAYFNTDFFRNLAAVGSLANTGVPPVNPYFSGETFHYYWFFHIIPACWSVLFPSFARQFLFIQFSLLSVLMFVTSLFAVIRQFCETRRALWLSLPLFLICGSYEGIYSLLHLKRMHQSWQAFVTLNIDGILRWIWRTPQVDALYRPLLYAPQHLLVLTIFLIALIILRYRKDFVSRVLLYFLIGASAGFSIIPAILLSTGAVLVETVDFYERPRQKLPQVLAGAALIVIFWYLYFKIFAMFSPDLSDLRFGLDANIFHHFAGFFFLNWGALLFAGTAGLFYASPRIPRAMLFLFLFLSLSLLLYVRLSVNASSDISLKSGYLSQVILVILSAGFSDLLFKRYPQHALRIFAVFLVFMIPAALTWALDAYNCQDISNKRFTTYINQDEAELLNWVSSSVKATAVVQNDKPNGHGFVESLVSVVPALGARSQFFSDPILSRIFQIPEKDVEERRELVYEVFHSRTKHRASILSQEAGINYLLSDEKMSAARSDFSEPDFTLVFHNSRYSIYRVNERQITISDLEAGTVYSDDQQNRITVSYNQAFYDPERIFKAETARWMQATGEMMIESSKDTTGKLGFYIHSLGRPRKMELRYEGNRIMEVEVPVNRIHVWVPLQIVHGRSVLQIHSIDGAERASVYVGGDDQRLLSFRIWGVDFKISDPSQ
jgi:hypothetical protein